MYLSNSWFPLVGRLGQAATQNNETDNKLSTISVFDYFESNDYYIITLRMLSLRVLMMSARAV